MFYGLFYASFFFFCCDSPFVRVGRERKLKKGRQRRRFRYQEGKGRKRGWGSPFLGVAFLAKKGRSLIGASKFWFPKYGLAAKKIHHFLFFSSLLEMTLLPMIA